VFNIRGIVQSTSILAVLGVGMTFVIVTGGIDLSVGSVLVFSGVVADKAMAAVSGGQGWGSAIVGALVAIACGFAWGLLNGFFIARAKVPPLIVTLGTLGMALGIAEVITGGVDLRNVPTVMVNSVGRVIGLFIPATLQNGFVIIGIQPFWQQVVVGAVLIAAVYVDQQRRAAALRGGGRQRMSGLLSHLTTSRQAAPAQE
jgi:ribose/xylose/arabinose/galactoside ABC-type transport system permease subunit